MDISGLFGDANNADVWGTNPVTAYESPSTSALQAQGGNLFGGPVYSSNPGSAAYNPGAIATGGFNAGTQTGDFWGGIGQGLQNFTGGLFSSLPALLQTKTAQAANAKGKGSAIGGSGSMMPLLLIGGGVLLVILLARK